MTNSFSLEDELAFAGRLADAAWTAIRPHFRALDAVDNKITTAQAMFDPVTAADTGAETAMRALIEAERPDHGIIGEEFPAKPSKNGYTWLLDPIDGTRAFVGGLPSWTTLIALCDEAGTSASLTSRFWTSVISAGRAAQPFSMRVSKPRSGCLTAAICAKRSSPRRTHSS